MGTGAIIPRAFYERDTVTVARSLLGLEIVFNRPNLNTVRARIVETEAYVGPDDRASHAFRGRTPQTSVMFGLAGHAYVYLIYGSYHCLNIVTERSGYPAAVLIRGVEPIVGITGRTDGPGRLCRELGIDRSYNGIDMTAPPLFLTEPSELADWEIESGPRVGVVYAGEWAMRPWRFWIRNNPHVSRPPRRSIGLGEASGVAS